MWRIDIPGPGHKILPHNALECTHTYIHSNGIIIGFVHTHMYIRERITVNYCNR